MVLIAMFPWLDPKNTSQCVCKEFCLYCFIAADCVTASVKLAAVPQALLLLPLLAPQQLAFLHPFHDPGCICGK